MNRSEAAKLRHARMTPEQKAARAAAISASKTVHHRDHWVDDLRPPPHHRRKRPSARYHPVELETDPATGRIPVTASEMRRLRAFIASNLDEPSREWLIAYRTAGAVHLIGFQTVERNSRWRQPRDEQDPRKHVDAANLEKGLARVQGRNTRVYVQCLVFTTPDGELHHVGAMMPQYNTLRGGGTLEEAERLEEMTWAPRAAPPVAALGEAPMKRKRGRPKGSKNVTGRRKP